MKKQDQRSWIFRLFPFLKNKPPKHRRANAHVVASKNRVKYEWGVTPAGGFYFYKR